MCLSLWFQLILNIRCAFPPIFLFPLLGVLSQFSSFVRFLLGNCQLDGCLLSHAVTLAKMPTCKFFLAGICVRDDCPYLHKKLNARADICADFLRGFCERAEQCDMRHEFLCAEHEATGKCERVRCPYPHRQEPKKTQRKPETQKHSEATGPAAASSSNVPAIVTAVKSLNVRYSATTSNGRETGNATRDDDDNDTTTVADAQSSTKTGDQNATNSDDVLVLIPSRPKLGQLPAYIPF